MALPPPSASSLLGDWRFDPAAALVIALAGGLYLGGVRRLSRRGSAGERHDHRRASSGLPRTPGWPIGRTASFCSGLAVLAYATMSGLARYDTVLLSLHTFQHVLLGMAAPLLIALGAPVTLALQASRRPTQLVLLKIVHNRVVETLTQPVVAWVLFGGTLFGLYFSPLFDLSLEHPLLHAGVHAHFVVVGLLFFWPAVGLDPMKRSISYPARLLYVLLAVPFHAFLGLVILSSTAHPLGEAVYGEVGRHWGPTLVADQRTAAGILWAVGDLFGLIAGGIVAAQWYRADQRRQLREDRRLDAAGL